MPKIVKVRVAVAVDKNGKWNSCGWSNGEEKDVRDLAVEPVDEGESLYWLTADLPIPEEQTVEAEVYTTTPDENLAGGRG